MVTVAVVTVAVVTVAVVAVGWSYESLRSQRKWAARRALSSAEGALQLRPDHDKAPRRTQPGLYTANLSNHKLLPNPF